MVVTPYCEFKKHQFTLFSLAAEFEDLKFRVFKPVGDCLYLYIIFKCCPSGVKGFPKKPRAQRFNERFNKQPTG